MVPLRAKWAAVVVLLIASASARAEQLEPAAPPAQLQQSIPTRPDPGKPADQGSATKPRDQASAPVSPGPAPQQFTPGMALAPMDR